VRTVRQSKRSCDSAADGPTTSGATHRDLSFLRDYAGSIWMRDRSGHRHKSYKAYVCLFVCIVTKVVHLKLVSDLSSAVFIKTLPRFVGTRGQCRKLFSDNGTNFRGADHELRAMFRLASEFYKGCLSEMQLK